MNSRKTGVGFNIPKSKIKPKASVSRQDSDNFSEAVANSTFWNLKSSGSYVYGARGTAGVTIINASTPGALTETFSSLCHQTDETTTVSYRCMDIDVTGNIMVAVSRSGTWEGTGIGYIETWDITTPGSATVIDVYTKNGGGTSDAAEASPHLYSAVECNGNYAYVSGQKSGFYIFDVSGATITLTGSVTTGSWETQGLCYNPDDQHVYCANYGFGLTAIDVSTPATPTVSDTLGTYTGGPDGDSLRPWDCVAHEGYLYCCCNVSNAFGDSTDRGLIVADISTPSNMSWVGYCQIPPADQDTWNSLGDRPYLGIERFENFIFIAGGHKGVYCFDISEPTKPRYCGIVAVPDSGDNLYAVTVQGQGGNAYLVYADGENGTSGSKKVYIDKIEIKKKRIINLADTTNPVAGTLTATQASSSQINISLSGQSDNVGVDHIILSWSPNGTDTWTQLDATWNGSTYNHTGLTASTQYFYRAVVYDAAGNNATATANATTAASGSITVPAGVLLYDDFNYVMDKATTYNSATDNPMVNSGPWDAAKAENTNNINAQGFLYTKTAADVAGGFIQGFSGSLPNANGRVMVMEMEGATQGQTDCYFRTGVPTNDGGSAPTQPADIWIQFWMYIINSGTQDTVWTSAGTKLVYPTKSSQTRSAEEMWLVDLKTTNYGWVSGTYNNITASAAGMSALFLLEHGSGDLWPSYKIRWDHAVADWNAADRFQAGDSWWKIMDHLHGANPVGIAENEWTCVRMHFDDSGAGGVGLIQIRKQADADWTTIIDVANGVQEDGFNFDWSITNNNGALAISFGTTTNSDAWLLWQDLAIAAGTNSGGNGISDLPSGYW